MRIPYLRDNCHLLPASVDTQLPTHSCRWSVGLGRLRSTSLWCAAAIANASILVVGFVKVYGATFYEWCTHNFCTHGVP